MPKAGFGPSTTCAGTAASCLLQGRGNVERTITCFYHQWRYALDGSLAVVPQRKEQFPDLVAEDWGLLPASLEIWEGMVFVHPDPAAPPLGATLAGVPEQIGSHHPGLLRQVATAAPRSPLQLEAVRREPRRHLSPVVPPRRHPRRLRSHPVRTPPDRWQLDQLRASAPSDQANALSRGTATIAHLDDRDRLGIGAHLVFPNLMIATAGEFFATYVAEPLGPDRTVIDLRVRAEAGADAAAVLEAVRSFIDEDIAACEAIQDAVESPAFAIGPLAQSHERPITAFQSHLLAAMGAP